MCAGFSSTPTASARRPSASRRVARAPVDRARRVARAVAACSAACWLAASSAHAADAPAADGETRGITKEEVEAWLDSQPDVGTRDVGSVEPAPEAPPPAPRHRGFVIESSLGAQGHIGALKDVSPAAPRFDLKFGVEPTDWLLLFIAGDMTISNTSLANPPPPPRAYALLGIGGGARFTLGLSQLFGLYFQVEAGGAVVTEDILARYGYDDADALGAYFGAQLGWEWYQVNPHLALALYAGARDYLGLTRQNSSAPPLAWQGSAAIRYAF